MWEWLKNVIAPKGENRKATPLEERDADREFERWQAYNNWFPEFGMKNLFPESRDVCLEWIKNGKPRHIEPLFPGSDPRIDAAYSQIDPSYMRGTSESEDVRRKRS
jgi:hypothetical protein